MESPVPYLAGTATYNAPSGYIDVRSQRNGKLLFQYDPVRHLVRCGSRGEYEVIDLTQYMK